MSEGSDGQIDPDEGVVSPPKSILTPGDKANPERGQPMGLRMLFTLLLDQIKGAAEGEVGLESDPKRKRRWVLIASLIGVLIGGVEASRKFDLSGVKKFLGWDQCLTQDGENLDIIDFGQIKAVTYESKKNRSLVTSEMGEVVVSGHVFLPIGQHASIVDCGDKTLICLDGTQLCFEAQVNQAE